MITQEISKKLKRQTKALKVGLAYTATAIGLIVGGVWLGFDKGQQVQAKSDIQQLTQWVANAEFPTVQLTYPGKMPVALIRNGACEPYPHKLPQFYHIEYVSPRYMPCATQHYVKPTTPSPALVAIENHTK